MQVVRIVLGLGLIGYAIASLFVGEIGVFGPRDDPGMNWVDMYARPFGFSVLVLVYVAIGIGLVMKAKRIAEGGG